MKLLGIFLAVFPAIAFSQQQCTNGKEFQTCGTACPLTCDNHQNPPFCTFQCVQGCFCPSGLVELNGTCVSSEQCPGQCTNGKEYQTCGTACPLTCDNHQNPPFCTFQCVQGCFCPSGLAQLNGTCVSSGQCPATTTGTVAPPTPPTCANGMSYNSCGTVCPLTCEAPDPRPCPLICAQGCFCPSGLLQYNGQCVNRSDCPATTTTTTTTATTTVTASPHTPPTCANGMSYNSCGTACPLTCDEPEERPCIRICAQGCFCPSGLLQYNGQCVKRSDCPATPSPPTPPTCANGMSYNSCGTACPLTCEAPDPGPCPLICAQGCFCPSGLLQYNGKCVNRSDCPATTTDSEQQCTNGKTYQSCGTACPLTCENYQNTPSACTEQCMEGCFCPPGLAQLNDGCVETQECPLTAVGSAWSIHCPCYSVMTLLSLIAVLAMCM